MSVLAKAVGSIIGRRWGRFKQFMALVSLGMMIGQTA